MSSGMAGSRRAIPGLPDACVGLGEEERDATAEGCQDVSALPREPVEEASEAQPAQVVGHATACVSLGAWVVEGSDAFA